MILNKAAINRLKLDATKDATGIAIDYLANTFIAAMHDEKIPDSKMSAVCERAVRYANYLDEMDITLDQVRAINKKYGYEITGGEAI